MEERKITAALKLEASQMQLPADLFERISRQGASIAPVRRSRWSRLRLGPALELAAVCIVIAGFLGIVAWRNLNAGVNQPSGESVDQMIAALRQQVSFPIFVPTEVPAGFVAQPLTGPSQASPTVSILYRTKDGSEGLRVTNGPAGCCLDANPTKAVGETPIRNGVTAYFLLNQPEFGGPILWWQESGAYIALSGPHLNKDDLVKIAASMSAGPTPEATEPAASPSAAAPGVSGGVSLETDRLFDKAIAAVATLDLSKAEPAYREFRIQDPNYVFACAYSPGGNAGEVQVLACRFGEAVNTVTGHALFWKTDDQWRGSYYPQASAEVARSRQAYFMTLGENCPIGCAGGFKALRQAGNRLLAVVDLSSVGSHSTEEVHLLERDEQTETWRILWVPTPDAYGFRGWPKVTLPEAGIGQFTTTYEDGRPNTWILQGTQFTRPGTQAVSEAIRASGLTASLQSSTGKTTTTAWEVRDDDALLVPVKTEIR